MRTLVVALALVATVGCTPEDLAQLSAAGEVPEAPAVADLAPASTPPAESCWYDDVATNGAENLAYPGPSQAAGNTYYACEATNPSGGTLSIWLAFYTNGTVYWGLPAAVVTPVKTQATCRLDWPGHGHATGAQLSAGGVLEAIDLHTNDYVPQVLRFTCSVVN